MLRRGRHVDQLEKALATSDTDLEAERMWAVDKHLDVCFRRFESELRSTPAADGDLLDVYYRYAKFLEERYATGHKRDLRQLLQNGLLHADSQPQRYRNDPRLLYLWLTFAAMSQNTGELVIFEHVHATGACDRLADFYLAYADKLEAAEDAKKATKIYREGLEKMAKPVDKLQNAFE